jgi:hypothetical protein
MREGREAQLTDYAANHVGVSFGLGLGPTYLCVIREVGSEQAERAMNNV